MQYSRKKNMSRNKRNRTRNWSNNLPGWIKNVRFFVSNNYLCSSHNPCPLPEELLPEDLSVDLKSRGAQLQRPVDKWTRIRIKSWKPETAGNMLGNRNSKKIFCEKYIKRNKAPTERLLSSVTVFSKPGEAAAPWWVKPAKECFQEEKTFQIYHWLKCGIAMIIWLGEWKNDWEIQTSSNLPLMYGVSMPCLQVSNTCLYCRCCHRL